VIMEDYLRLLKEQFNNRIAFREKRPGILQLLAPLYHEDGDMVEIFLEESPEHPGKIRICDYGMTLMRLSYSYQINTPNKERIFRTILSENSLSENDGNIYIDLDPDKLYAGVLQFAQTVAKVCSMRHFGREVVRGLFYEMVAEYIETTLKPFCPKPKVVPLPERDDLEVDYSLTTGQKPIFLFAVKDVAKARLATICCLEFQKAGLSFRSVVVHEDFTALPKKDQSRLTSAVDKQFVDLDDFRSNGLKYLEREAS